jgi:hypothetical protein
MSVLARLFKRNFARLGEVDQYQELIYLVGSTQNSLKPRILEGDAD